MEDYWRAYYYYFNSSNFDFRTEFDERSYLRKRGLSFDDYFESIPSVISMFGSKIWIACGLKVISFRFLRLEFFLPTLVFWFDEAMMAARPGAVVV